MALHGQQPNPPCPGSASIKHLHGTVRESSDSSQQAHKLVANAVRAAVVDSEVVATKQTINTSCRKTIAREISDIVSKISSSSVE